MYLLALGMGGASGSPMNKTKISPTENPKACLEQQVNAVEYDTSREGARELVLTDQDLQKLRNLLLDGVASPQGSEANGGYFEDLRNRIKQASS